MTKRYRWRGGTEQYLQYGAGCSVTLLVLPALFEEANRMRRFTVSVMRALAEAKIGTILPDLPGTGESLVDISDVAFDDWRDAVASAAAISGTRVLTLAIRGGALLDGIADAGWRLAPDRGERLLRDMVRATALGREISADQLDREARTKATRLAGNTIAPSLYCNLHAAVPASGAYRIARLDDDSADCDVRLTGQKLWRAAEPGDDEQLTTAAAADVVAWVQSCGQ